MSAATFDVKRLSEDAKLPTRGTPGSAGLDLYASEGVHVPARGRALVKTDIAISFPKGTYGQIAPRSGLAFKHGIDVGAGVIDPDYTGPIGIVVFNHTDDVFIVNKGLKMAQLIFIYIAKPAPVEVEILEATLRGSGGFGSTDA